LIARANLIVKCKNLGDGVGCEAFAEAPFESVLYGSSRIGQCGNLPAWIIRASCKKFALRVYGRVFTLAVLFPECL
jgi:hypothetical protein